MAGRMPRGMSPGATNAPSGTNRVGGGNPFGGGGMGRNFSGPVTNIPLQTLEQVSTNWPASNIDVRLGDYMLRPHQKWMITAVTNSGGYLGSPYFKITLAGTDRALAATAEAEVLTVPAFTGAPEQLWRIDQLADGTYRLTPKAVPGGNVTMVLSAIGGSSPTLERVDANTDRQRWLLRAP